jgi:putative endonuclease
MAEGAKQAAERRGRRAETLAALWLRLKGYRILARRVRLPVGEIDLIARRGSIIAFIEVKARQSRTAAETAVPEANWRRINRAAQSWVGQRRDCENLDWRFDLVMILPHSAPIHLRNHWRPDFAPTGT